MNYVVQCETREYMSDHPSLMACTKLTRREHQASRMPCGQLDATLLQRQKSDSRRVERVLVNERISFRRVHKLDAG
jgi:hypothetical protein